MHQQQQQQRRRKVIAIERRRPTLISSSSSSSRRKVDRKDDHNNNIRTTSISTSIDTSTVAQRQATKAVYQKYQALFSVVREIVVAAIATVLKKSTSRNDTRQAEYMHPSIWVTWFRHAIDVDWRTVTTTTTTMTMTIELRVPAPPYNKLADQQWNTYHQRKARARPYIPLPVTLEDIIDDEQESTAIGIARPYVPLPVTVEDLIYDE